MPAMQETWVQFLDRKDSLEKEMVTHTSILAWEIPGTEETGGVQLMGSRVGYNLTTKPLINFHMKVHSILKMKVYLPEPDLHKCLGQD